MAHKKVSIITQARVGSTRFPQKVLQKINGGTMLELHIKRLQKSLLSDSIIVATTFENQADQIVEMAKNMKVRVFQGSTSDVLDRFYNAALLDKPDYVVRVTSDCPLIDAELVDKVIKKTLDNNLDYCANVLKQEYPDGQDIEVFKFSALEIAWKESKLKSDREHVTPFIRRNSSFYNNNMFQSANFDAPDNYNNIRMTVDEKVDLETIKILVNALGTKKTWIDYSKYIIQNSTEFSNQNIIRNEGFNKSLLND
jgi:spore coat polysaccharide biosynthesis protein SpsF (cytidylyltransferase family)